MTIKKGIESGSIIQLPYDKEFSEDYFIVTRVRPHLDTWILDAVCDGQEDLSITVSINDVVKVD